MVIAIPSYHRERWLVEQYLDNIYTHLILPFKGQIKLFMFIQDPNHSYIDKIDSWASQAHHVKIEYAPSKERSIAEVRYECLTAAIEAYPEECYFLTADDDMYIIDQRVTEDYGRLIENLWPETTYVLYPGCAYTSVPYIQQKKMSFYMPSMLRGQVYWKDSILALDPTKLKQITCGEDYVLPRLMNNPIEWVTGFNENLHLCSRTIYSRDILRKWSNAPCKVEAERYWNIFKNEYDFESTGFWAYAPNLTSFLEFGNIYPEYFDKQGYYL
jgi:hypothetical protein